MDSEIPSLPSIDLFKSFDKLKRGTTKWELMCKNVCEFLEEYGCVVVEYEEISPQEMDEVFGALRTLLSLPAETKLKNAHVGKYMTYFPPMNKIVPYTESFAAFNPALPGKIQDFTQLMWPEGNQKFCQVISSMSQKMLGLMQILIDVISDNYGMVQEGGDHLQINNNLKTDKMDTLLRMFNYIAPKKDEPEVCLPAHIDTNFVTVLFNNGVEGLVSKSKDGKWFKVNPGKTSFILFVGQSLKAWSNGRLHAPLHKVTLNGEKDRLTWVFFFKPKEDQSIEPHTGFIDEEHPLRFKPFLYKELHDFMSKTGNIEGSLESFVGI